MGQPSDGRLERLVRAGVRITAERTLERVLQEVADSAREVIGARYAALGVLNADGTGLSRFVTSGVTPEQHARIGDLPQGKGILGLLIADPRPLRLPDLTRHAAAYGFPPNHPPMRSFLGVPILGREGALGNLYLTEKLDGPEFSSEDEQVAVMLAAQAAVAVENARLYEATNRLLGEREHLQASRDRFFAMINHELRNALTGVYGWSELLIRKLGADAPRAALEVHDSAERTLRMLNDLLDLSRLEAAKLRPIVRASDACAVVREAVGTVEPAAEARNIRIATCDPEASIPCHTDAQRVRQILVNLLANAIRHSPEGATVQLDVKTNDSRITFEVVDQGEGMTADQQELIFEAFQRGEERERGTGLGLTLSRQLARLLGGDLRVQSRRGHGARFTLDLPREPRQS